MGQIKAGAIEKGSFLVEKGHPYLVVEREFVSPGKGSAFVRLKLKNLRNGSVQRISPKTQDTMEEINIEEIESQYLYADPDHLHFMNTGTYEQFTVALEGMMEKKLCMREGESYRVMLWQGEALDIQLPPKVDLIVTEAERGVKGDSVTGASKLVTVETGLVVKVPLFIKQGEKIRISTETREYQERVNN